MAKYLEGLRNGIARDQYQRDENASGHHTRCRLSNRNWRQLPKRPAKVFEFYQRDDVGQQSELQKQQQQHKKFHNLLLILNDYEDDGCNESFCFGAVAAAAVTY